MKRLSFLLAFCLLAVVAMAQPAAGSLKTTIKAGKFMINKAVLAPGWKVAPVVKFLGESRIRNGVNKTHSYDDLGVVLFEKVADGGASGNISEFQFYISAGETNAVSPSALYTGKLVIDGLTITRDLTAEEMQEKLSMYKKTDSYMDHNFRMAYKGIYIYFQFDEDETRLVKVSVGPDKASKE
jgi:hypothetical protein